MDRPSMNYQAATASLVMKVTDYLWEYFRGFNIEA